MMDVEAQKAKLIGARGSDITSLISLAYIKQRE